MAVNETIVTGRYFRRCTDAANKVWQRISFWHKASDCEFDDNKNAQTKVGAIKGITTSTSVTETGYAADMTTVKNLQTQIDELNSNLGSNRLLYVANLNASGLSTTDMFSTIATDPNDIITLSDKNIVINQSGSLKIVISGNGNVTSGNAAIKINGSLVLSVSGTSANNSKTINVSKGDIITGSCYAGSYGGYMNNRITMYYEP